MADYYAILTRAVAALADNTGEARRDVYEKARRALVSQLKSFDPPLPPAEITSQRLTLEEAIRKVEAEAARASLGFAKQPADSAAAKPAAPKAPAAAKAPAAPAEAAQPTPPREPAAAERPVPVTPRQPTPTQARPQRTEGAEKPALEKRKGVDIFRRAVAEAGGLGAASSEATRAAREVLHAAEDDTRTGERHEPEFADDTTAFAEEAAEPDMAAADTSDVDHEADHELDGFFDEGAARPLSSRTMWLVAAGFLLLLFAGAAAFVYSQRDVLFATDEAAEPVADTSETVESEPGQPPKDENGLAPKITDRLPTSDSENGVAPDAKSVRTMRVVAPSAETPGEEPAGDAAETPAADPEVPAVITADEEPAAAEPDGSETPVRVIPTTEAPASEPDATEAPADEAPADEAPATPPSDEPAAEPAATDAAPAQQRGDTVLVGQRALLYEEGKKDGTGNKAYIGNVTWSLEDEPANAGTGTDAVLVAHAEIPERGMTIDIKIRPNRDASLPASHWIEIGFDLPNEFSEKGISNVPGLILKTTEQARGDALRGASARVLANLFWIALSQNELEKQRNEALLKERGWIDIPVLYETNQRAILTLEKGTPGDQMIEAAFTRWNAG